MWDMCVCVFRIEMLEERKVGMKETSDLSPGCRGSQSRLAFLEQDGRLSTDQEDPATFSQTV